MRRRFVVKANSAVRANVSATPVKDKISEIFDNGEGMSFAYELLAYVTEDQAAEIWEAVTGEDFEDNKEYY